MGDVVTLEYRSNERGHIAIITLNNEKKLNSMNQDQFAILGKCMREVALRDDVYVTVLTGKGRYFSAYVLGHISIARVRFDEHPVEQM